MNLKVEGRLAQGRFAVSLALLMITLVVPSLAGAALPDNRAWEMVSPLNKEGGEVRPIDGIAEGGVVQAAEDGNSVTYTSFSAFENPQGAPFGSQYLSSFTGQGWSTQNISTPTADNEYLLVGAGAPYKAFTSDLSKGLFFLGRLPELPGEPQGYPDFRIRDNTNGQYTPLLTSTPLAETDEPIAPRLLELELVSTTSDLSHILLTTRAVLTPNAVYNGERNLYEWINGHFEAINILPGAPHNETTPNNASLTFHSHMVSGDGSRVIWTSQGAGPLDIFVRDGVGSGHARTVRVDASQGPGESGEGNFQEASSDGGRVFFLDKTRLTDDSTAGGVESLSDLYEFDVSSGALKDLTVDENPGDPGGASALGVMGASQDGAYLYFVANGALPQAQPNTAGEHPTSGLPNLYLHHGDTVTYIAKLSEADENLNGAAHDWNSIVSFRTARVSADGKHLVFMAAENLTSYDSEGMQEVYVYDADSKSLQCASCNPSGAAPLGPSSIPGGTSFELNNAIYQSRVLSDDSSRVFFDSSDALTPQDTNDRQDVYEWEREGAGSCTSLSSGFAAASGGCVGLISGGTYNDDSTFVDASGSGGDVFFITGQQLVSQDTDELVDLYDARENGGITPPPTPPACSGTGCQGVPPAPPIFATPASATFAGEGNFAAAAVKPAVKSKAPTRAQKLAVALRACGKWPSGKERAGCRARARRRYAPVRGKGSR